MKNFFAKLNDVKQLIRLEPQRKEAIRTRLLHLVEAEPLHEATLVLADRRAKPRSLFSSLFRNPMPAFAMGAIFVLVGGGTSFAAQGALPGDALYAVKTGFNEKIVTALQFTTEAQANYESELAGRRLEEAAELTAQGTISPETQADIERRFSEHAEQAQADILKIKEQGDIALAAGIASRFEAQLQAHGKILAYQSGEGTGFEAARQEQDTSVLSGDATMKSMSSNSLLKASDSDSDGEDSQRTALKSDNTLSVRVNSILNDISGLRSKLEAEIGVGEESNKDMSKDQGESAARAKITATEKSFKEIELLIANKKKETNVSFPDAEARLKVLQGVLITAHAKIESGFYGEAFSMGNQVLRELEEIKLLIQAQSNLNIRIEGRGGLMQDQSIKNSGVQSGGGSAGINIQNNTSIQIKP